MENVRLARFFFFLTHIYSFRCLCHESVVEIKCKQEASITGILKTFCLSQVHVCLYGEERDKFIPMNKTATKEYNNNNNTNLKTLLDSDFLFFYLSQTLTHTYTNTHTHSRRL